MTTPHGLATLLLRWGHLKANDSGWPFDGRYTSYPRFKRERTVYRETYHSVVNDDLAAKTLREKYMKGDALRMVSHLDDLQEIPYGTPSTPASRGRRSIWKKLSGRKWSSGSTRLLTAVQSGSSTPYRGRQLKGTGASGG